MSLYMSSHRRRKKFPYAYFGYAAIISALVLLAYALSSDVPFPDILNGSLKDHMPVENGIAATVLPVLSGIMGIGVVSAIKANFKAIPFILHFAFFLLLSFAGFVGGNGSFEILDSLLSAVGVLYFLVLGLFMFLFNNADSKYSSVTVAVSGVIPLIPFSLRFYMAVAAPASVFTIDASIFGEIINIMLIVSLFLYTAANSAYLAHVDRKASHR